MKGMEERKNVKTGNEKVLEKSSVGGMNKRSKIKDTIKPDLKVSLKEAKIERQRVNMLKPQLLSVKEMKRKKTDCSWRYIQWFWC